MKEKVINEQIMSAMIDRDLYSEVRKFCFKNGIKVKKFIAEALMQGLCQKPEVYK